MKNILSIQPAVSYGHVGNSAAVFPLQRIGHEVWPVYTVNFSNPTAGYGSWKGPVLSAEDVREVIAGIGDRGALKDVDVVLSGHVGGDVVDVVVDAVAQVKELNPGALFACGTGTEEKLVSVADILCLNQDELGDLTEIDCSDLESTLKGIEKAKQMGPSVVLVTNMIASDAKGTWIVETPKLPLKRNGVDDVTCALFTGRYAASNNAEDALSKTASSVFDVLEATYEADSRELLLVESQDFFANPRMQFEVREL